MVRAVKNSSIPRTGKGCVRQGMGKKTDGPCDPRPHEDDPYHDLRIPEDDQHDAASDEYIWPEYEDEDDERV